MYRDEIVEEVRAIRYAQAAKHNFDVRKIFADARKRQQESGRKVVRLRPNRPQAQKI